MRTETFVNILFFVFFSLSALVALDDCHEDPVRDEPTWRWESASDERRADQLALEVEREAEIARARARLPRDERARASRRVATSER